MNSAKILIFISVVMILVLIGVTVFFMWKSGGSVGDIFEIRSVSRDLQQAKKLWSEGKYQEMLAPANHALSTAKTDEDKGYAYYWIGVSYFKQDMLDEAETNENKAIQLLPKFSGPYITLAAIYLNRSQPQVALKYASTAVQLDPKYGWAHNALGIAYQDLGDKINAIKEFKEAVRLDENNSLFRLNLTRAQEN